MKTLSKQFSVSSLQFVLGNIILSFIMLFAFSCKKEKTSTFHKDIIKQTRLNKTESFVSEGVVDVYKINYITEGLNIEGFIAKPMQHKPTDKFPVIIYCRGGNQSFGMLDVFDLKYIHDLALKGFVVLASQLRGNFSSEGVDEFGGKDVNDILKMIDIAKDIDFVDAKNIHVLGYSRGGMNTYQVSKLTDNINSIAVVGGTTTLFNKYNFRSGAMYHRVTKPLVGDSIQFKDEYIKRSAIFWHDKINEPTLILHGKEDIRVEVEEARRLIDSFKMSDKKDFQFKIFEDGNHGLSNFKEERDSLIINWFKKHNK